MLQKLNQNRRTCGKVNDSVISGKRFQISNSCSERRPTITLIKTFVLAVEIDILNVHLLLITLSDPMKMEMSPWWFAIPSALVFWMKKFSCQKVWIKSKRRKVKNFHVEIAPQFSLISTNCKQIANKLHRWSSP